MFGMLTHFSGNQLGHAIAAHYWIDIFAGIEEYLLFLKAQESQTQRVRKKNTTAPSQQGFIPPIPAPHIKFFDIAVPI